MAKIKIEKVINILEAGMGEVEYTIPSDVLESVIEYLKDYEQAKIFITKSLVGMR